jgi:hypothetical protein
LSQANATKRGAAAVTATVKFETFKSYSVMEAERTPMIAVMESVLRGTRVLDRCEQARMKIIARRL